VAYNYINTDDNRTISLTVTYVRSAKSMPAQCRHMVRPYA